MGTLEFAPDQSIPYSSSLNESFGRVAGHVTMLDQDFNNILRALEGIQAIIQLVIANSVAKDNMEDAILNPNLIGGLEAGVAALAFFSINAMEAVADRHDKATREVSHG